MYKSLALLNGMLLTIMILANGLMSEAVGTLGMMVFIHITGLTLITSIVIVTKEPRRSIKGIHIFYLLGGVTGLATVSLTNISFIILGATTTLMFTNIGQIITSSVIDHFGLFGMKRYPFNPVKLVGLSLMIVGLVLIILS